MLFNMHVLPPEGAFGRVSCDPGFLKYILGAPAILLIVVASSVSAVVIAMGLVS